jgi:hypothetical protein
MMMAIVAGLVENEAFVAIEATAVFQRKVNHAGV